MKEVTSKGKTLEREKNGEEAKKTGSRLRTGRETNVVFTVFLAVACINLTEAEFTKVSKQSCCFGDFEKISVSGDEKECKVHCEQLDQCSAFYRARRNGECYYVKSSCSCSGTLQADSNTDTFLREYTEPCSGPYEDCVNNNPSLVAAGCQALNSSLNGSATFTCACYPGLVRSADGTNCTERNQSTTPDMAATTSTDLQKDHIHSTTPDVTTKPQGGSQTEAPINEMWTRNGENRPPIRHEDLASWCPQPLNIVHATEKWVNSLAKDIVTYTCDYGYSFPDGSQTRSAVCGMDGKWTYLPDSCQELHCPALSDKSYTLGSASTKVGTSVTLSCKAGLKFAIGKETATVCLQVARGNFLVGEWTPPPEQCKDVCPKLPAPAHGSLGEEQTIYGHTTEARCDDGYSFPNNSHVMHLECLDGGTWNVTLRANKLPDCQAIVCDEPPVINNASRSKVYGLRYKSKVRYECNGSLTMEDGKPTKTITCESAGWSEDSFTCADNRCPPVPKVANAAADTTLAVQGTVANYTCLPGFNMTDAAVETTLECDGKSWKGNVSSCKEMYCNPIEKPHLESNVSDTVVGSRAELKCQLGYQLHDADGAVKSVKAVTAMCNVDGKWEPRLPTCEPVVCGPDLPKSLMSSHTNPKVRTYGSVVQYECLEGYRFKRDVYVRNVTCTETGSWEPDIGDCKETKCKPIPRWMGVVSNSSNYSYRSIVNVTCAKGTHFPKGVVYIVSHCGADGNWDPFIPGCIFDLRKKWRPAPTEAKHARLIGGIFLVVVVAVFAVCITVDVVWWYHGMNMKKLKQWKKKREKRKQQ